ncbi:MAG TPA: hypothetical protein VNH44_01450 [Micropepsaceae bacterium]|nr:hypothetical protein [Micropepsaceae bacterium]
MTAKLIALVDQIQKLHDELDREIVKRRAGLGFNLSGKFVQFEKEAIERHRRLRMGILTYLAKSDITTILTAPVIYAMIFPIAFLDLSVTIFQHICFRVYGIRRVNRSEFIVFDRRHLSYLNWIEALNCIFCGYANGTIGYAREVASRTEQYWCPIKHALRIRDPHQRYFQFLEYGDADGYRSRLADFRKQLAES